MASLVVLILGSGPRVGAAVASTFASAGYKVAIASRKGTNAKNELGYFSLKADLTKPETVPLLFDEVKKEFGTAPSVVVYNAGALTPPSDPESVFSVPAEAVTSDLNINTVSPYVAAQQAVLGWKTLPTEVKKSFIYTGNITNVQVVPWPMMMNAAMGKSATAAWIGLADTLYAAQKYRFFYADERNVDGTLKGMKVDGPAHGQFYAQLAGQVETVPWHATFVKDKGYTEFK